MIIDDLAYMVTPDDLIQGGDMAMLGLFAQEIPGFGFATISFSALERSSGTVVTQGSSAISGGFVSSFVSSEVSLFSSSVVSNIIPVGMFNWF
jgi:hypothetical protein